MSFSPTRLPLSTTSGGWSGDSHKKVSAQVLCVLTLDFGLRLDIYNHCDLNISLIVLPNLSGYSGKSTSGEAIGKMPVWGPGFKVSFDFYINSLRTGQKTYWEDGIRMNGYYNYSSIFSVGSDDKDDYIKSGEGLPAMFIGNTSLLCITFPLNGNPNKGTCGEKKVAVKTWYTLDVLSVMEGSQV